MNFCSEKVHREYWESNCIIKISAFIYCSVVDFTLLTSLVRTENFLLYQDKLFFFSGNKKNLKKTKQTDIKKV